MENIGTNVLQKAETAGDILDALNERSDIIRGMDLSIKEKERQSKIETSNTLKKLCDSKYFNALGKVIETFHANGESDTAKNLLKDLLVARNENLGKFYEMMAYYFLMSSFINFEPQIHIPSSDCYKKDEHGYDADGLIKEWNCVFDVKMFGVVFPHIKTAEKKLQEKINKKIAYWIQLFESGQKEIIRLKLQAAENESCTHKKEKLMQEVDFERKKLERMEQEEKSDLWKYKLKMDGHYDIAVTDLKKYLLGRLDDLADELARDAWDKRMERWENSSNWESENMICKHGLGFIQKKVEGTHLTCSMYSPIAMHFNHGLIIYWHESDKYEWAQKNRFYFMHDASQFVRNRPYMIICAFDKESSGPFLQYTDSLHEYFRELCRRIFIDLNRMTDRKVDDGKAIPVSISETSKKLTGIMFIETSAIAKNERKDYAWVYLNPNADNPLLNYQVNQFHNISAIVEDYKHDNY